MFIDTNYNLKVYDRNTFLSRDAVKEPGSPSEIQWKTIVLQHTPQQSNCNDCGVYLCHFAALLSVRQPVSFDSANMLNYRYIDCKVILEMDDRELSKIPRTKKGSTDSESEDTSNRYTGNQNALKGTRQVKLVLMKKDKTGQFTKIWTQKGSGSRKLPINKSAKKDEIIKLGKQIYFGKDGISKLGSVADFNFEIKNFEGEVVDDTLSVGDLYTATGLTLLTFYILLTPVEGESLPKLSLPNIFECHYRWKVI
ncbi:unnamed protein product [Mytilus coruscus]|uniref:Ubiquitin-like protease family profile domain-containing protein n=1 Tax=Mytilus coruscus TaxID=42192 RepID=A0A6J8AVQ5_MYTCO|nr:unnamed protein product [Mytilus coruscus]